MILLLIIYLLIGLIGGVIFAFGVTATKRRLTLGDLLFAALHIIVWPGILIHMAAECDWGSIVIWRGKPKDPS